MDDSSHAHETGLDGNHQDTVVQPVIFSKGCPTPEYKDLSMGCWIIQLDGAITGSRDDPTVHLRKHGADRHFSSLKCIVGLLQGICHETGKISSHQKNYFLIF